MVMLLPDSVKNTIVQPGISDTPLHLSPIDYLLSEQVKCPSSILLYKLSGATEFPVTRYSTLHAFLHIISKCNVLSHCQKDVTQAHFSLKARLSNCLYTLQEQRFRQAKNPSFTVKVFKGGLKGGLKCLIQLAVVYLEIRGPFFGEMQHFFLYSHR